MNRSANATIKGYFYQLDHSILQLLKATKGNAEIVVEGIEDVDVFDDKNTFIQCKYYEGTQYNHSVIKDAVIEMLKHYNANKPIPLGTKYRFYGFFQSGQEKLTKPISVDFAKKNFFTYTENKVLHEVHKMLGLNDNELQKFLNVLEIDVWAHAYDAQLKEIEKQMEKNITGCSREDAECFFYPIAIDEVRKLAIQNDISKRKTTKARFIKVINKKEVFFSSWIFQLKGQLAYLKSLKRKYFTVRGLKLEKKNRYFVINMDGLYDLSTTSDILSVIANKYSHKEHRRTTEVDRFCPFVYLSGLTESQMVEVKVALSEQNLIFSDGYDFKGATFSSKSLSRPPTKEHLTKLKIIDSIPNLNEMLNVRPQTTIELFSFYQDQAVSGLQIPGSATSHEIKLHSIDNIKDIL